MGTTTFSGPVVSTNGFTGALTGNVTGAVTGAVASEVVTATNAITVANDESLSELIRSCRPLN